MSKLAPSLEHAHACLRKSTPSLPSLSYPADAEQHFGQLKSALREWWVWQPTRAWFGDNYTYLEDAWHSHFEALLQQQPRRPLHELFGPYIPLFVDWCTYKTLPLNLVSTLRQHLRPNVAYITVSVNDDGPSGTASMTTFPFPGYAWNNQQKSFNQALKLSEFPNLLVLSAGGYGHVPIPQLKRPAKLLRHEMPVEERTYDVSFVGSMMHGPWKPTIRNRMLQVVHNASRTTGIRYVICGKDSPCEKVANLSWQAVMHASRVSLCPRGYGRNSFHLSETIQLGRLPLQVYSDVPFVPYGDLYEQIGWSTNLRRLPAMLEQLSAGEGSFAPAALRERERRARAIRDSHYSIAGVLEQIGLFMTRPEASDLRCIKLPPTPRGLFVDEMNRGTENLWVLPQPQWPPGVGGEGCRTMSACLTVGPLRWFGTLGE